MLMGTPKLNEDISFVVPAFQQHGEQSQEGNWLFDFFQ
jgi:hypothetical protein